MHQKNHETAVVNKEGCRWQNVFYGAERLQFFGDQWGDVCWYSWWFGEVIELLCWDECCLLRNGVSERSAWVIDLLCWDECCLLKNGVNKRSAWVIELLCWDECCLWKNGVNERSAWVIELLCWDECCLLKNGVNKQSAWMYVLRAWMIVEVRASDLPGHFMMVVSERSAWIKHLIVCTLKRAWWMGNFGWCKWIFWSKRCLPVHGICVT
jgi:hypothetical protein